MAWTVEVCDRFGGNVTELTNYFGLTLHERLEPPCSATLEIGTTEPQAAAIQVLTRDLCITRDGQRLFWGPITGVSAGRAVMRVDAHDPFWHLLDNYFGPIQFNYVTNPNGASGTTGWTNVGITTFTADSTDFVRPNPGSMAGQSFKLVQAVADADAYMQQTFSVTAAATQATVFTFKGHAKVDVWNGAAFEERGLYLARSGDPTNPVWDPITADAPVGKWQPYEVEITVPAAATETLTIRNYAINGTIRWGALSVSVYESTGTPTTPEDAIHPINRVIDYAQDPANGDSHWDMNITKAGGVTGTELEIHYQFSEHGNIGQALLDYTRKGICDFGWDYDADLNTRTLEVFSPQRGTFQAGVLLDIDLDAGGSVGEFEYRVDAEQTYSAVRYLGTGDGPDREIGYAVDTSATGGIVRELVQTAPQEATVADLDRLAREELARASAPVRVPTLTTHEVAGDVISVLRLGDTAQCTIDHGWVQESAVRRIVGREIDARTDTMRLEVNA